MSYLDELLGGVAEIAPPRCDHPLAALVQPCPSCAAQWSNGPTSDGPTTGPVDWHEACIGTVVGPSDLQTEAEASLADLERGQDLQGLSDDEATELLRQLDRDACLESLAEFVRLAWAAVRPGVRLEWGPHIEAVCQHVQWQLEDRDACVRDESRQLRCQNLLINVPPRSLKSTILTFATVWAWLRWPDLGIMYLSANPRVAMNSAREARALMASQWFLDTFRPSWTIRSDRDALSDMGNTAGGFRIARGLDSMITGEGCAWLIIDDPHDARDSQERVQRAIENYDTGVANRINDPRTSIRTCIMQRLRVDDFSGHVLESGEWQHLRLPMEYEREPMCKCGRCVGPNVFGWEDWRKLEGDVLHPRFTRAFLEAERKRLMSQYVGQHQQRPVEVGGQLFKIEYWGWASVTTPEKRGRPMGARDEAPFVVPRRADGSLEVDWLCVSVDATGGSVSEDASGLGIVTAVGVGMRRVVIDDASPGPRTWNQTKKDAAAAIRRAVEIAGKQSRILVLVEKKALGASLIGQLEDEIREAKICYPDGSPVIARVEAYDPGRESKEQRALAMESEIAAGLVCLLDGAPWLLGFLTELGQFPKGSRDDRVDALAQLLWKFRTAEAEWVRYFRERAEQERAHREVRQTLTPATNPRKCEGLFVDGVCRCAVCVEAREAEQVGTKLACKCDLSGYVVPSATEAGVCTACGGYQDTHG